ncbi:MAG: fatty acid desaturase [Halioglobus sp.]|nr:fatty acid desaturase [Halioglobus sp.]
MSQDLNALNREAVAAAKHYMGQVSWLTVVLTIFVLLAYCANLALFASGVLNPWIATGIMGALTHMSYTPLHEAVHGNISGKNDQLRWLNAACGYLMAPLIANPYSSHHLEHFTHHRFTNQPGKDPDYIVRGMREGLLGVLVTLFRFFWLQNTFFVIEHWRNAAVKDRAIYCAEVSFSLGWRVAFLALVTTPGAGWVILFGYFLGGLFSTYWFAYRPHAPYKDSARYRNTNSLVMPAWMKPVGWFWLGQHLHSIHHLFPRVPFYHYHALHREIEPILRAQGTPIVGIFTREPVPAGQRD